MTRGSHSVGVLALATLLVSISEYASPGAIAARDDGEGKPSLSLSVSPSLASTPARISARLVVTGGADDYEEYYCPEVEWDWGDDTKSRAKRDCDPYEPAKSRIGRRYTIQHTYHRAGQFRVTFRMLQGDRVVGLAVANVQIQPGLGRF
ncbi:MAG: hypothetical protein FJW23_04245 [Acidimicrobiia bacterium]|nr:hypothetical protein [Acidimicrobiia bacterium]